MVQPPPEFSDSLSPRSGTTAPAARQDALGVVLIYAAFSALWILLSDRLLAVVVSDTNLVLTLSMLKGWFFVGVTSVLLYLLIRRLGGRSRHSPRGCGPATLCGPWPAGPH